MSVHGSECNQSCKCKKKFDWNQKKAVVKNLFPWNNTGRVPLSCPQRRPPARNAGGHHAKPQLVHSCLQESCPDPVCSVSCLCGATAGTPEKAGNFDERVRAASEAAVTVQKDILSAAEGLGRTRKAFSASTRRGLNKDQRESS